MIIGLIEQDQGKLIRTSLQILSVGKELAQYHNTKFFPVIVGEITEDISDQLTAHGASEVYQISHPRFVDYAPDAWAESIVQLVKQKQAKTVIAVGTDRGNEVLARLAARLSQPFSANCTEIQPGDIYRITRLRWGGSLFEEAELHGDPHLLTIAAHVYPVLETPNDEPLEIHSFSPELDEAAFRVRITGRIQPESGVSLADAKVVIGGGRGVGSAEGFEKLETLAAMLGGVVGGSRVVTNLGWRPHTDQIGQTGTRIAPDLYIACGISGATQHWVGCMRSKTVLAINTDPEAPIIEKADYAVIGNLHEVIPALCEELKKG